VLTDHSKERRTFMRMVVDAPVTVIYDGRRLAGICRDLSANGMSIEVEEEGIKEGDELLVSLATSSNLLPPFQAQARVMRAAPGDAVYRLGVEFVSVV
jgi:hypothetical protein